MDKNPQELARQARVEALLRLKRYERPPGGYFEDFLTEFQRRQRSDLLSRSSRSLFCERFATYVSGFGRQRWVYGAGVAYATLAIGFFALRSGSRPATAAPESADTGSSLWSGLVTLAPESGGGYELTPTSVGDAGAGVRPAGFGVGEGTVPSVPLTRPQRVAPAGTLPFGTRQNEVIIREY
jgi:hypothetical protein